MGALWLVNQPTRTCIIHLSTAQMLVDGDLSTATEPHTPMHTEPHTPMHTEPHTPMHTEPHTPMHSEPHTPMHTELHTPIDTEPPPALDHSLDPDSLLHSRHACHCTPHLFVRYYTTAAAISP